MATPPDEIDRINERLEREAKLEIQDRDSYDLAFSDLLNLDEDELSMDQKKMRSEGFNDYVGTHPDVSTNRLFSKAKGKDLRRDRLKTAKRVVKTEKDYIKGTAPKVDLKGYDTARQRTAKKIRKSKVFTIPTIRKGKVVHSIKTSVVIKGNTVIRYRDMTGKFTSIYIKKK